MPGAPRREAIEETFSALKRVVGAMQNRTRAALANEDLSPPQVFLLRVLKHNGDATPSELAEGLGVTPASVTGLLNKLEEGGLVVRTRSDEDRRIVRVAITPAAEARLGAMHEAVIREVMVAFEGWTMEEIEELKAFLDRLGEGCC